MFAGMMELVDVLDSKSSGSDTVSVRPRLPAPKSTRLRLQPCAFSLLFLVGGEGIFGDRDGKLSFFAVSNDSEGNGVACTNVEHGINDVMSARDCNTVFTKGDLLEDVALFKNAIRKRILIDLIDVDLL